jgi:hypothetical protein
MPAETIELSPLELGIDLIVQQRVRLRREVAATQQLKKGASPKSLQMCLQGSVLQQVHAGATELAVLFLEPSKRAAYNSTLVAQLQAELRLFLDACKEALAANEQLIDASGVGFHTELHSAYVLLERRIAPYLPQG